MTDIAAPVPRGYGDPVAAYEALRSHVLAGSPGGGKPGLVVLLRQGLAAWLWSRQMPVRLVAPFTVPAASPIPADAISAALVRLLAGIALNARNQEVVIS